MPMFNNEQNNNNNLFAFNLIDIISLIIGLQNMELNISAKDLDKQTQAILDDLHVYLDKQEKHLASQDDRIARLENILLRNIGILDKE